MIELSERAPLTVAYSQKIEIDAKLATLKSEYETATSRLRMDLAACERTIAEAGAGFDVRKIAIARAILSVRGKVSNPVRGSYGDGAGVREGVVRDAIKWFVTGEGDGLARRYYGAKNYDGFGDQRTDCEYGMGPRHGSIVFSIELAREARVYGWAGLDVEQREAAIYFLTNLAAIEKVEA